LRLGPDRSIDGSKLEDVPKEDSMSVSVAAGPRPWAAYRPQPPGVEQVGQRAGADGPSVGPSDRPTSQRRPIIRLMGAGRRQRQADVVARNAQWVSEVRSTPTVWDLYHEV